MDGAGEIAGRVVADRAGGYVGHAVAVDVADAGHGRAERVGGGEVGPARGRPVHLYSAQDGAAPAHEHYVDGAGVFGGRVVGQRAGGEVGHAVAVDVADAGNRPAEAVAGGEVGPARGGGVDLGRAQDGAVPAHEQQVDGAAHAAVKGADRHVRHAVAVDVADAGHGRPEKVAGGEVGPARGGGVDLDRAPRRAVPAHEHYVDGAGAAAGVVAVRRADRHVRHAVAVDVAYSAHAQEIEYRGGRPAKAGPVHLDCPQDRAVPAHEQRVQRGPYDVAFRFVHRADCQVGHAVAVDVADQGHRHAGRAAEGKRGRRGRRPVGGHRRPDRLDFHAHAWRVRASAPLPLARGAAPGGAEPDLNA